jgi:hypothetical protein
VLGAAVAGIGNRATLAINKTAIKNFGIETYSLV